MKLDIIVSNWINTNLHGDRFLDFVLGFISNSGNLGFIWIVLSLVFMLSSKTRKTGLVMLVSLGLGFVLSDLVIKPIIAIPRPYIINTNIFEYLQTTSVSMLSSFSFPSGHSVSSSATAFALYFENRKLAIPSIIYAILVSFSRLYFCVHYFTDVIVGFLIGIIVSKLVSLLFEKLNNLRLKGFGIIKVQNMLG